MTTNKPSTAAETRMRQITAVHSIITPICRENRGTLGALEEAFRRIREEYIACQNEANQNANFHVMLAVTG